MADHCDISRQNDQGHTGKQPSAVAVCRKLGVLSTRITGKLFRAQDFPQLLLHYFLNTNNNWEPVSLFKLTGSCR